MALLTEEQRQKLKEAWIKAPYVNETCIGCSACVAINPEVFSLSDETNNAYVMENDGEFFNSQEENIKSAVSACPVNAISYE